MKKLLFHLLAALLCFAPVLHAQQRLKIATVSMERLFNDYYQTGKVQREINIERARIQRDNNERLAKIREIDTQLQQIREELKKEDLGEKEKADFFEESNGLAQDGKSKERERKEFLNRRNRALSDKMRKQMRGILVKIQRSVSERAKEGNYDFIFDVSANSNQGIPFVLHARETTDLTNSLLAEINEGSEAE
ncbi:OmpH family outer membrane protein [Akkermansiaceae bacterium]|nr:OmpH family outer membrane protein [Akkermansiaceae bacterium]|tara:strand:- start:12034 stop:12612 length:579 start_codon:yes stop_codon:yes gene_type:complete